MPVRLAASLIFSIVGALWPPSGESVDRRTHLRFSPAAAVRLDSPNWCVSSTNPGAFDYESEEAKYPVNRENKWHSRTNRLAPFPLNLWDSAQIERGRCENRSGALYSAYTERGMQFPFLIPGSGRIVAKPEVAKPEVTLW